MPQRRNAVKRMRVDKKRKARNQRIKANLRKTIKDFLALVSSGKMEEARASLKTVFSKLDKAAKKKIIHKNTAGRKKSRLSSKISKTA
ncbi:MAG: 30S ribosomal protein S20 [Candidatus Omnitrophica bacterium]|nr:30S ribosomal protein S20 [Candidatus Omnitrophota bacterium]